MQTKFILIGKRLLLLATPLLFSGCLVPSFEALLNVHGKVIDSNGMPIANKSVRLCAIVEKDLNTAPYNPFDTTCVDTMTDASGNYSDQLMIAGEGSGGQYGSVGITKLYTALQVDSSTVLTDQQPDLTEACRHSGPKVSSNTQHCVFDLVSDFDQRIATPSINFCSMILWYEVGTYVVTYKGKRSMVIPLTADVQSQLLTKLNGTSACFNGAIIERPGTNGLFLANTMSPVP